MNLSQIKEMAVAGSTIYYDYLALNGKGISAISVRSIESMPDGFFLLHLDSRLSAAAANHLESLQFRFYGYTLNATEEIVAVRYTAFNAILTVKPNTKYLETFSHLEPQQLTVFSDMKFLVKRVGEWYENHGLKICPPEQITPPSPTDMLFPVTPSDEQRAAIHGALSAPLSYVWGAPGTGKTKVVLSSCILSLLHAKKKIFITAPTNNALEQMLYGILPVLRENGINYQDVIRLGIPSARFARKYPGVCEPDGLTYRAAQLRRDISGIKNCISFRNRYRKFFLSVEKMNVRFIQLHALSNKHPPLQSALSNISLELSQIDLEIALLQRESMHLMDQSKSSQKSLDSASKSILRYIFPGWYARIKAEDESSFQLLKESKSKLDAAIERKKSAEQRLIEYVLEKDNLSLSFSRLKSELISLASISSELSSCANDISESNLEVVHKNMGTIIKKELASLTSESSKYAGYKKYTDDDLANLLDDLTAQEQCLSIPIERRMSKVSLVAATMDKFMVTDFSETSFHPDHVFLDEAGYCPLVKGAALLFLGVPVTLLGDHMQLPPVCEMDAGKDLSLPENRDVCIWAQSSIYLDSLFHADRNDISTEFLDGDPPSFPDIQKYELTETRRFGPMLADILANYVYSSQFHSLSASDTELFVLDAPKREDSIVRTSRSEIEAISTYLAETHEDDYVILTPYRLQLTELTKAFPNARKNERVLTVHASQGREWDTVLLSVVDTNRMWYCNSRLPKSKGLQVVNTAVSRARKRLVLVCDYDYWVSQPGQLIGQLVQSAKRLN